MAVSRNHSGSVDAAAAGPNEDELALLREPKACAECGYTACWECAADERRGHCKCPSSNFGEAYADSLGPRGYMGVPGGRRYKPPRGLSRPQLLPCHANIYMLGGNGTT